MELSKFEHIWNLARNSDFETSCDIDTDLKCTICRKMMINACNVPCGCRHCLECIKTYLGNEKKYCPGGTSDCHNEMITFNRNVLIDQPINNRIVKAMVKCPRRFCEFQDELRKIEDHMKVCNIRPLNCPFANIGCAETELFSESMKNHLVSDILSHSNLLTASIDNSHNDIGLVQADIGFLERKNRVLITEIDQLRSDRAEDRLEIASLQERDRRTVDQLKTLEQNFTALRREMTTMHNTLTASTKEKRIEKESISKTHLEVNKLRKLIDTIKIANSAMKDEIKTLDWDIKNQQELSKQLLRKLNKEIGDLNSKSMKEEIDELKVEENRKGVLIVNIQATVAKQSQCLQTLNEKLQKIDTKFQEAQKSAEQQEAEILSRTPNVPVKSNLELNILRKDLIDIHERLEAFVKDREVNQALLEKLKSLTLTLINEKMGDKTKLFLTENKNQQKPFMNQLRKFGIKLFDPIDIKTTEKKEIEELEKLNGNIMTLVDYMKSTKEDIDSLKAEKNMNEIERVNLRAAINQQAQEVQECRELYNQYQASLEQMGREQEKITTRFLLRKFEENKSDENLSAIQKDIAHVKNRLAAMTKEKTVYQETESEMGKLKSQVVSLTEKLLTIKEEIKAVDVETKNWQVMENFKKVNGNIAQFGNHNKSMKEEIGTLKLVQDRKEVQMVDLKEALNYQAKDVQMFILRLKKLEDQFQETSKETRKKQGTIETSISDVTKAVKKYEAKANNIEIRICELEIYQENSSKVKSVWNISKFSFKRKNKEKIQSCPFHTHKGGYTFCLRADFQNDKDNLIIYFGLMRGPFDALLQWPFNHVVRIGLINQQTGLVYDSPDLIPEHLVNSSAWDRPITKSNGIVGVTIMNMSDLLKIPELVQRDTISIQCIVEIDEW